MASPPPLFTATRAQTLTYLLGVCPFSIAFLVFINSSISFVVTELVGVHEGQGDVVGTLGFADELLALAACPLWGVLSDRIGVRYVSFYCAVSILGTVSDCAGVGLYRGLRHRGSVAGLVRPGRECLPPASPGTASVQLGSLGGVDHGDGGLASCHRPANASATRF